jgi:tetratricopeptide (TPR) repeat protein
MKGTSTRLVRIVLIAVLAWVVYLLLDPYGLGWLVLPGALVMTLGVAGFRLLGIRRARRAQAEETRWADALLDAAARRTAITELRAALAAEADSSARTRRTLLLADLLDADGAHDEAKALLDGLSVDDFSPIEGAMVRHARASIRLRMGDVEGARGVLVPRAPRSGAEDLDRRLELLDAVVDAESGEAERALETASRVRRIAGTDEGLAVEARIIRAVALDARGDHDEAIAVFRELGPEMRAALLVVGYPRVRALATEASGGERGGGGPSGDAAAEKGAV